MKKIFVFLFVSFTFVVSAQKKQVTLENIWKEYKFYPKTINGLKSMNDGIHFTKINKNEKGQFLNKYSFESGQLIDSIVSSSDLNIIIDSYEFSENEQKIIFATKKAFIDTVVNPFFMFMI